MKKIDAIHNLKAAIDRALQEAETSDVLSVITGAFVGLTVQLVHLEGHDSSKEIMLDGRQQRDITIHAEKNADSSFNKIIH